MANEFGIRISGVEDVEKALSELSADLRRKVVRGALRDASRPFVKEARRLAPVLKENLPRRQPGTLRRNIKAFTSKKFNGRNGVLGVYVSVRASKKDLKNAPITGDPYYWRWVEGGHKIVPRSKRIGTKNGKAQNAVTIRARRQAATKMVAPNEFIAPSARTQSAAAIRIFEARIVQRIAKAEAGK